MTDITTPLVKTSAAKAWIGTVVAGVLAFLAPIGTALHSGAAITGTVWFDSVVAALVFAGAVFPSIYYTTNKPV
jgi:hypothetical protein